MIYNKVLTELTRKLRKFYFVSQYRSENISQNTSEYGSEYRSEWLL